MMVMIKMMLMVGVLVKHPLQTAVVDNPLCRYGDMNDIITLNFIVTTLVQCLKLTLNCALFKSSSL